MSFLNGVAMTTVYQSGTSGLYVLLSKCVYAFEHNFVCLCRLNRCICACTRDNRHYCQCGEELMKKWCTVASLYLSESVEVELVTVRTFE